MEDLLVATILEELFKTSSRVFYKEHTALYRSSHDFHLRTVQSMHDDVKTTFNCGFRTWSDKRNVPHLCRQKMIYKFTRQLTCLTVTVCIARFTDALVASSDILTSSTVLTRGFSTLIYV